MARPSSQDPRNEVVTERSSGRRAATGPPTPAVTASTASGTSDDAAVTDARTDQPTEALPAVEPRHGPRVEDEPVWGGVLDRAPASSPTTTAPADRTSPSPNATKPDTASRTPVSGPDAALVNVPVPTVTRRPVVVTRHRRPRVRRVTRVVRAVDTWSVFKISVLFYVVLYLSALLSAVLLWNVAYVTGTVDNVERFLESFGWETFEFNGGEIYRAGWVIGLFLVVGLTGLTVLAATTFNLITDLVGGVRVTVLEEEVVVRAPSPAPRVPVTSPPTTTSGPLSGPPSSPASSSPSDQPSS